MSSRQRDDDEQDGGCCYSTRLQSSLDDIKSLFFWKACVAEFLGTFILVIAALGSTIQGWHLNIDPTPTPTLTPTPTPAPAPAPDIVQIALSFGLCVATSVWIVGHISGGHINPAVTMGMLVTRRISLVRAIMYIVSQIIGAIVAAAILKAVTPKAVQGGLGCTGLGAGMTAGNGCVIEFFITMFLVLTVFAACDSKRTDLAGSFPLSIGLSVTMGHLWAVEFTGSSMNTARSVGPALVMNKWDDHWIYWVGPLAGGAAAGLIYDFFLSSNSSVTKVRDSLCSADFNDDRYQVRRPKDAYVLEDQQDPHKKKVSVTSLSRLEVAYNSGANV